MRLHRFYLSPETTELDHTFWLKDERLRNQWQRVLRYRENDQVILFDGVEHERLYKILRLEPDAIQLELITEFERKIPTNHVYLFCSLLKKDKNDWVLQKCTELGIRNFVPIIAERSEKTGFNLDRAQKIVIEAAEQCGRSDIPNVREPLLLDTAIEEYKNKVQLLICHEELPSNNNSETSELPVGIFIGPEGGWTDKEINNFQSEQVGYLNLGNLTLRAETAAVAATTKLLS